MSVQSRYQQQVISVLLMSIPIIVTGGSLRGDEEGMSHLGSSSSTSSSDSSDGVGEDGMCMVSMVQVIRCEDDYTSLIYSKEHEKK